jgi:hypothetical protein
LDDICNEVLSGREPCQDICKIRRFGDAIIRNEGGRVSLRNVGFYETSYVAVCPRGLLSFVALKVSRYMPFLISESNSEKGERPV